MAKTLEGIIGVYKPKGPSSHDIIATLRKRTGVKTIGHAGTLDPLASGVLVVGIGRAATRQLHTMVEKEKEYVSTIHLGATSTTDDAEGEKKIWEVTTIPSASAIKKVLAEFIGAIEQIPPRFSAINVKGHRAYQLARSGKEVFLTPRKVLIKKIELLHYSWPLLIVRVTTGPGVYIRSLARDIGKKLATGGYIQELERTRVGEFTKNAALVLDEHSIYIRECVRVLP